MACPWAFAACYKGAPAFVTQLLDRDGVVGPNFHLDELGGIIMQGRAGIGIVDRVDALRSPEFDPGRLDPLVRSVWQNTTAVSFRVERLCWNPLLWLPGVLVALLCRAMKQMVIPSRRAIPGEVTNQLFNIDTDCDGSPDHRVWVRRIGKQVYYVATVLTYLDRADQPTRSYLRVVLPLFRSNAAFVFRPSNLGNGGLRISTSRVQGSDAGTYLVIPGESRYWMIPFFGLHDVIEIQPTSDPNVLNAVHRSSCLGSLGITAFSLHYTLRPKTIPGVSGSSVAS